jgi:hypothetical protein
LLNVCRRVNELKAPIRRVFADWAAERKDDRILREDLTLEEWEELDVIVMELMIFESMTLDVQNSTIPTISSIRDFVELIRSRILPMHSNDTPALSKMRKAWNDAFDEKFQPYFEGFSQFAVYLFH